MICLYILYITLFTIYHVRAYVHTCAHRSSGFGQSVRSLSIWLVAIYNYNIVHYANDDDNFIFMPPLPAFFYVKLN